MLWAYNLNRFIYYYILYPGFPRYDLISGTTLRFTKKGKYKIK